MTRSLETTEWKPVFTKARKHCASVQTQYDADVHKKQLIRIRSSKLPDTNEFKMGDLAEYSSYNMSYYGHIVGITEKRITIVCRHDKALYDAGETVKKHSLDLDTFCWRNIRWDAGKTAQSNSEWMD